MSEEQKTKVTFESEIECPYCKKSIIVKKEKMLVNEPIKPEYEENVTVEKNKQKAFDDFGK